ncbi:MAG TPA: hypothetical protein VG797_00635 [Phycisphaerales bacterium]|nr:hypothetical protein [Phycisphaerales bacterium]
MSPDKTDAATAPTDFIDVDARATALGLNPPHGICFLPRNFEDAPSASDLLYEGDIASLRILFRQAGIIETRLEPDGLRLPVLEQKSFELAIPTICVAVALLSENASIVNIALGIVANYATDFFKGMGGEKRVRFAIIIKDTAAGRSKCFKYRGDVSGIKDFTKLATRINNDDSK